MLVGSWVLFTWIVGFNVKKEASTEQFQWIFNQRLLFVWNVFHEKKYDAINQFLWRCSIRSYVFMFTLAFTLALSFQDELKEDSSFVALFLVKIGRMAEARKKKNISQRDFVIFWARNFLEKSKYREILGRVINFNSNQWWF